MRNLLLLTLFVTACFTPDLESTDEETGSATDSSTGDDMGGSQTDGATSGGSGGTTPPGDSGTSGETTTGTTGTATDEPPNFGEGEPPDLGDPGPEGNGAILAVHALSRWQDPVDVWLVGETEPRSESLAPGKAVVLDQVSRAVRRLVFTEPGTTTVVGCSDWFLLRREEQWASIASRERHDCAKSGESGATVTFRQELPLDANPVRYVHAAAPDPLTINRDETPESGTLEPLGTLQGTDLPDCSEAGCSVSYAVNLDSTTRHFTFKVGSPSEVPPPGEVVLVVLGNPLQGWPREPDAATLLRVDLDGSTTVIKRDPEVAFIGDDYRDTSFEILAQPTWVEVAVFEGTGTREPSGGILAPVQRYAPGSVQFQASSPESPEGPQIDVSGEFELEAGRRYLLLALTPNADDFSLIPVALPRGDDSISLARALNLEQEDKSLTLGWKFGDDVLAFEDFTDLAAGALSDAGGQEVSDGDSAWMLLYAEGGAELVEGCGFNLVTPAGFRGLLVPKGALNAGFNVGFVETTSWPPLAQNEGLICF